MKREAVGTWDFSRVVDSVLKQVINRENFVDYLWELSMARIPVFSPFTDLFDYSCETNSVRDRLSYISYMY